jgi:hypothetical protein
VKSLLLDSVNTSQPYINDIAALLCSDYELNGQINRAANQGAKFSLLLAMLEQNCLHRPQLEKSAAINLSSAPHSNINHYRSHPLSANEKSWQTCQYTSRLIHQGHVHSAQLWLAMHPEPLSHHNQPQEIDEEIIANCSLAAQNRYQQNSRKPIQLDEVGLYDILQQLEPVPA